MALVIMVYSVTSPIYRCPARRLANVGPPWLALLVINASDASWIALSSPAKDRPLVPAVERLGRNLRASAESLSREGLVGFESLYAPRRHGLGFQIDDGDRGSRTAWVLLGEWLVAWAVGVHAGDATIGETHDWFWGSDSSGGLSLDVRQHTVNAGISTRREVHALLPYLLDPSSVGTRRGVLGDKATDFERKTRKRSGVYYTPGDVAAYMVDRIQTTSDGRNGTTWLDLAQGSGAFLRGALSLAGDVEEVRGNLYGIDIDRFAAEAASFVLTAEDIILRPNGELPAERWHEFRRNFATSNTLFIDAGSSEDPETLHGLSLEANSRTIADFFPEIGSRGFSRVIANPPYARLFPHQDNAMLPMLHPVAGAAVGADISPIFVELGVRLLADDGAMCMVLPLSHVTSSRKPFPELRSYLISGNWRVDFESYDRVPDALFGDDIKTRNAIVTLDRTASRVVSTTSLRRWTSRRRERVFEDVRRVDVTSLPDLPTVLPKIGSRWERDLYESCIEHSTNVGTWIRSRKSVPIQDVRHVDNSHWSEFVAIAPTAYNYLGVVRDASQAARDGHDSGNPVTLLRFESAHVASAAYALLSSRLAFWLWHTTGDGFHASSRTTSYIPVPALEESVARLAELGEELWLLGQSGPVISRNRGRTTVSYPTWMYSDTLARIDREVDLVLGVEGADRLARWHEELMVVDTDSERLEMVLRKTK